MQINFGKETRDVLIEHGYSVEDIDWIGNENYQVPIINFFDRADAYDYDNGYGGERVPTDIILVMNDGSYFSRYTYDGAEWWIHNKVPQKPKKKVRLKSFCKTYLPLLEEFVE